MIREKVKGEDSKMLGADPEFELKNLEGRFIPACQILHGGASAGLGTDGSYDTGEMRKLGPGGVREIMSTVASRMRQADRDIPADIQMFAGSGSVRPLGGHIHFSGVQDSQPLVSRLDKFICQPLREVSDTRLRDSCSYGRPGETRYQPHGWEYRSPASWIAHPKIAKGAIMIAAILAKCAEDGTIENVDTWDDLKKAAPKVAKRQGLWTIYQFLAILRRMKENQITLEQVEVFQAWKKRPAPASTQEEARTARFNSQDEVIDSVEQEFYRIGGQRSGDVANCLSVAGANRSRGAGNYLVKNPNTRIEAVEVEVREDDSLRTGVIYLSIDLRRNPVKAAQVVYAACKRMVNRGGVDCTEILKKMDGR